MSAIPSLSATFGTPVTDPANPVTYADIALDEARHQLYLVNTVANEIEVYSIDPTGRKPPAQTTSIKTQATPLAIAMSRSGQFLYVTCYGASTLDVIDLSSAAYATQSITLAARPQGVAVGFNEKVLISTIGTGTGQDVLITYDPTADASNALNSVTVVPSAPATPTLPPPNGVWFLASSSQLRASQDGTLIIGVNELANNSRTVFVYDAASSVVLASRNISQRSPVLAVSPDGSQFLSGPMLFETSTLFVLAQQNTTNSPYTFPNGANFNTQVNQGGAAYLPDGSALLAAYNIVPLANPVNRANIGQLLVNRPDNLLIQQGLQLPENFSGKMVITSDGSTIYALSQSGFTVLPLAALANAPIAVPDWNVALLAFDNCGVTAAQNSATIPVRNAGRGRITLSASLVTAAVAAAANSNPPTSTTSPALRTTPAGNLVASFNPRATASPGTVAPDLVLLQAPEAVNILPNVRVFQNFRTPEAAGNIIPLDIGASATGLTDMLLDAPRQLIYVANPGLNRIEVFDIQQQTFVNPISTGQLPRSLAFGTDGNTLYVAESGGETIGIIDLTKMVRTGRVSYPRLPFNSGLGLITPMILASSQQGPQVIMSNGTLWRIVGDSVLPRTLNPNIFGTATSVPSPQTMVSTADGSYVLVLAGNGSAYLYSAQQDDFVRGMPVIPTPIRGYYGPVAAGPSGEYYLVNGQVLNRALTPVSGTTTGSRPVSAVAAVDANTFAQFSIPVRASSTSAVTDAGMVQIIDATTGQVKASANALEGPLAVVSGTGRANIMGRTMVIGPAGALAYVLTSSGLSAIPLAPANTQNAPSVPGGGMVNAASFTSGVAPDGLVSIFGQNLADNATASDTPLPTFMGGTCVTLNTTPLPLLATSAGQINAQLPPGTAATRQSLVVHSIANHLASGPVSVTVSRYAPAIFVDSGGAAIYHANGQRVDKNHPATRDEPLTIYATGLGATTGGRVASGMPSPSDPLAVTGAVDLYFGDPTWSQAGIIVDWSGLAPGMIGVYQINCRIPGNHINGDGLPVTLKIGGVSSPTTGPTAAVVYVH